MSIVYEQLRAQARRYMRGERSTITLQSTALVHEAYVRLVNAGEVDWRDRAHFFALSAQIMRRILIDAARSRAAVKRAAEPRDPMIRQPWISTRFRAPIRTPRRPRFATWTTPLKASAGSIREGQR